MIPEDFLSPLIAKNDNKIILFVMDGLGGLPHPDTGLTELETAKTPNLDALAKESILGLGHPVGRGITPGSGPGHLSLFGYDPIKYLIGRGVLAACGIGFPIEVGDVASRINFATIDENDNITDRRAGRIPTETNEELCKILDKIEIPGVKTYVQTVKQHRACVVFRGGDLGGELADSDPQKTGVPALPVKALSERSNRTAELSNEFVAKAKEALKEQHPANMVLLRGFAEYHKIPGMLEKFGLKCAAIATYPMYKGVARLVGMDVLQCAENLTSQMETLKQNYDNYDYFFVHFKYTDSSGEDGDFDLKVKYIEEADSFIPQMRGLNPECMVVTGDHSTPARLKSHSWHPSPILLYSPNCRIDANQEFGEGACSRGGLGHLPAMELTQLMLAHAQRLDKYGA
ncbi:2,3-bisphosphoglycerate-independent phosphoglycerate mutase [Candidatus Riflebacteria bacterium]